MNFQNSIFHLNTRWGAIEKMCTFQLNEVRSVYILTSFTYKCCDAHRKYSFIQ